MAAARPPIMDIVKAANSRYIIAIAKETAVRKKRIINTPYWRDILKYPNNLANDLFAKVPVTRHVISMTMKMTRRLRSAISVFSMFGIKSDPKIEYGSNAKVIDRMKAPNIPSIVALSLSIRIVSY